MIEKIIANGKPGAAAAALDVAFKLGLNHGGWCALDDAVPERYHLERLPGAVFRAIIEKGINAADGALHFVHGKGSLDTEQTKKAALRLNKPFLLIDTARESSFSASRRIAGWIVENHVRVLHVSGEGVACPPDSMAQRVAGILEATLFLAMMDTGVTSPLPSLVRRERFTPKEPPPETLEAALQHLERSLSLKDKATIANMAAEELVSLHFTLGDYINNHFDLFTRNIGLLSDCQRRAGRDELTAKDAAAVIIRFLWERLRDTCRIRLVK